MNALVLLSALMANPSAYVIEGTIEGVSEPWCTGISGFPQPGDPLIIEQFFNGLLIDTDYVGRAIVRAGPLESLIPGGLMDVGSTEWHYNLGSNDELIWWEPLLILDDSVETPDDFSLGNVTEVNYLAYQWQEWFAPDAPPLSRNDCLVDLSVSSIEPRLIGDSDLNGLFESTDLITIFQRNEYEDGIPLNSTWEDGDWTADGDFTSYDLIMAMQAGHYEQPAAAVAVPELTALHYVSIAGFLVLLYYATRRKVRRR